MHYLTKSSFQPYSGWLLFLTYVQGVRGSEKLCDFPKVTQLSQKKRVISCSNHVLPSAVLFSCPCHQVLENFLWHLFSGHNSSQCPSSSPLPLRLGSFLPSRIDCSDLGNPRAMSVFESIDTHTAPVTIRRYQKPRISQWRGSSDRQGD